MRILNEKGLGPTPITWILVLLENRSVEYFGKFCLNF